MSGVLENGVQEAAVLTSVERQVISIFTRMAQMLSLPRSIGEIYGLLFLSEEPLHLDDFVDRLGISKGSASQGLRLLRSLGAVRGAYVPGDRREHFIAELELRKIARGFLKEQIEPRLRDARDRLDASEEALAELDPARRRVVRERLARLSGWHRNAMKVLPAISTLIKT